MSSGNSYERFPQPTIEPPTEFMTEHHPCSKRPTLSQGPEDDAPWHPFRCEGDFEFARIALGASLSQAHVNALLDLIARVAKGTAKVTFKNEREFRKACDAAAAEGTPVCYNERICK